VIISQDKKKAMQVKVVIMSLIFYYWMRGALDWSVPPVSEMTYTV